MLADKLSTLSEKVNGCKINSLVQSLDKKDAEALIGAIKNPNLSARGISGALASEGLSVGRSDVSAVVASGHGVGRLGHGHGHRHGHTDC